MEYNFPDPQKTGTSARHWKEIRASSLMSIHMLEIQHMHETQQDYGSFYIFLN